MVEGAFEGFGSGSCACQANKRSRSLRHGVDEYAPDSTRTRAHQERNQLQLRRFFHQIHGKFKVVHGKSAGAPVSSKLLELIVADPTPRVIRPGGWLTGETKRS